MELPRSTARPRHTSVAVGGRTRSCCRSSGDGGVRGRGRAVAGVARNVDCVCGLPGRGGGAARAVPTAWAVEAIGAVGEQQVTAAVLELIAPYWVIDGGDRIETFWYVIGTKTENEGRLDGRCSSSTSRSRRDTGSTRRVWRSCGRARRLRARLFRAGWKWSECRQAGSRHGSVRGDYVASRNPERCTWSTRTAPRSRSSQEAPTRSWRIDAWVVGDERCVMFEFESRARSRRAGEGARLGT